MLWGFTLCRKDSHYCDLSNGWCEIALEDLQVETERTLSLNAGTPWKPASIENQEPRAERSGFFSSISKSYNKAAAPQLSFKVSPWTRLDTSSKVLEGQSQTIAIDPVFAEPMPRAPATFGFLRAVPKICRRCRLERTSAKLQVHQRRLGYLREK